MSLINRDAMIIYPKQPLYDWMNLIFTEKLNFDDKDYFGHERGTVFLIPELEDFEHFEKWIQKNFKEFFEESLNGWCTEESLWPKKRNHKLFREWFHVTYQSMVIDVLEESIEHEED